jgi:beta-lactamase class C
MLPSRPLLLFVAAVLLPACSTAPPPQRSPIVPPPDPGTAIVRQDLGRHFGVEGSFLLLDPRRAQAIRYNRERGEGVYFFAANSRIRTAKAAPARIAITGAILGEPGLLGSDSARFRSIVDAAIRPLLSEHDVPGMAVAITIDGRTFFFNYGVASRESGAPVTEETLFELGSVSKTLTATLATYAHALGKLSLDDRPGRYMPQLQGSAMDQVSLLHLGTYTAGGLPLQFPDEVSDDARMIRYFRQWQLEAAPGTQRRYSNPSIGLFGRIAGLALQGGFAEALESRLLPELELNGTHVVVPEHAMPRYAWGYNAANEPVRVNPGMFDAEAYGIKSTAADLIRFVQWNIDASGLEEPMRRAIEGTHAGYYRVGATVQGLGWEQYPYPLSLERLLAGNSRTMIMESNPAEQLTPAQADPGPTLFNKTGSTGGFGAYVAFVPQHRVGIVMLANRNYPIPARIRAAHTILEQLVPKPR